jgi:hypothetical protein
MEGRCGAMIAKIVLRSWPEQGNKKYFHPNQSVGFLCVAHGFSSTDTNYFFPTKILQALTSN